MNQKSNERIMSFNAYLAEYIERVQESLSVFSFSDHDAREHIRLSDDITKYNPKLFIFEILFLDGEEKVFYPHVSNLIVNYPDYPNGVDSLIADLNRLYQNKRDLEFDWIEINEYLKTRSKIEELEKKGLISLPGELEELDEIYKAVQNERTALDASKYQRVIEILNKLVKRYEVESVPSNLGVNALIYEAWHRGEFLYLSHDTGAGKEAEESRFEQLLSALFVEADVDADFKIVDMAEDLGLLDIYEGATLFDGRTWLRRGTKQWFKCVEYSIIHRTIESNRSSFNRYLIHYPLIIDDYRFVGFAYLYSNWESSKDGGRPELFTKAKYPKIYHYIQSISESLNSSLRRDALAKALKSYDQSEEEIFYQAVKEYLVCFSVFRQKDPVPEPLKQQNKLIYEGHGVWIYGPEWIGEKHQQLLRQELEGKQILGEEDIPGLWQSVQEKKQRRSTLQLLGWQQRASQMSHQAAGLVAEVWCDPNKEALLPQTIGCLWHLKTLIDVWGNRDLKAQGSISDGPEADFPDWETLPETQILEKLIDIGLAHALRRATSSHTERDEDQSAVNKALEMAGSENALEQFRELTNLCIEVESQDLSWLTLRGFALCFHHCFWQAAYHSFRAICAEECHTHYNHIHHLLVQVSDKQVNILNCADPMDHENRELSRIPPRDQEFFETLNKRIGGLCTIEGPTLKDDFWQTTILLNLQK